MRKSAKNSPKESALRRLFRRKPVADLSTILRVLGTSSRMTMLRHLKPLGYQSSYSHSGTYYTLLGTPDYDDFGLWFYQGIGFSRRGTLKMTVKQLIDESPTGYQSKELEALLRTSVHNTLLDLKRDNTIRREPLGTPRGYVYFSIDPERGKNQLEQRRAQVAPKPWPPPPVQIPIETAIVILLETIHSAKQLASPSMLTSRLVARGYAIVVEQVEAVFANYGIHAQKKIPVSNAKRRKS